MARIWVESIDFEKVTHSKVRVMSSQWGFKGKMEVQRG